MSKSDFLFPVTQPVTNLQCCPDRSIKSQEVSRRIADRRSAYPEGWLATAVTVWPRCSAGRVHNTPLDQPPAIWWNRLR
jgi:hypothetical protein